MTSFKEMVHSFSKSLSSGIPVGFIKERGETIRARAFKRGKREENTFNLSRRGQGTKIIVDIIRDRVGKNIIQVMRKGRRIMIVVGNEEISVKLRKTFTNLIILENKSIKIIPNRENYVDFRMNDGSNVEKFGVSIAISQPFAFSFLFPENLNSFEPFIKFNLKVVLQRDVIRSLGSLLERNNFILKGFDLIMTITKMGNIPGFKSFSNRLDSRV